MRDIIFYIEAAKQKQNVKSDNALNKLMGFKGSMMSFVRLGKSHLSDEKMIELARLGGQDETTALMDLNMWRTSNTVVQKAYAKILHRLSHAACMGALVFTIFGGFSASVMASPISKIVSSDNVDSIYYGIKMKLYNLWIKSKSRINSLLRFPYYNRQPFAYG